MLFSQGESRKTLLNKARRARFYAVAVAARSRCEQEHSPAQSMRGHLHRGKEL
jgi:hypothetical protein